MTCRQPPERGVSSGASSFWTKTSARESMESVRAGRRKPPIAIVKTAHSYCPASQRHLHRVWYGVNVTLAHGHAVTHRLHHGKGFNFRRPPGAISTPQVEPIGDPARKSWQWSEVSTGGVEVESDVVPAVLSVRVEALKFRVTMKRLEVGVAAGPNRVPEPGFPGFAQGIQGLHFSFQGAVQASSVV
jgi:hypothetical protein